MKKPSKSTERRALDVLSRRSYIFYKLTPRNERYSMIAAFDKRTRKMSLRPAVAIKLVVPEDSVLGAQIVALYKTDKRKRTA